jgi:hypothetical protein
MAKKPRGPVNPDEIDEIPKEIMAQARERAIRKQADILAMRELGIDSDEDVVIKGPRKIPGEKQFEITLDLAPHSDKLVIDSKIFLHGATYKMGERLYNTVREMIHRGWEHQREIDGKNSTMYREKSNVILRPDVAA